MPVDKQEIESFLQFIDSSNYFTFAVLDTEKKRALIGSKTDTAAGISALISGLQLKEPSASLHVTLNACKPSADGSGGSGRRTGDISYARVFCVDLDRIVASEELKSIIDEFQVSLVVASSPGKYHLYWKIQPGGSITLDLWSKIQLALANNFQGDYTLSQITKTIRVPGVPRMLKTGETFTPKIVWSVPEPTALDYAGVETLFPCWEACYTKALDEQRATRKKLSDAFRADKLGSTVTTREALADSYKSLGRNNSIYMCIRERASRVDDPELTEGEALALGGELNNQIAAFGTEGLGKHELNSVCQSALKRGLGVKAGRLKRIAEKEELLMNLTEEETGAEGVLGVSGVTSGTNGHSKAQSAVSSASSSASASGFPYDYTDPELKLDRFTDSAVVARVKQRFNGHFLRVGKILYVFDDVNRLWLSNPIELLHKYVALCAEDCVHDSEFIQQCCMKSDGTGMSQTKLIAAMKHFRGNMLISGTTNALKNDGTFPREQGSVFDSHANLFYCKNGVLDLVTGELRSAKATDYLLRRSLVTYNPDARCPGWCSFLEEVFEESEDREAMLRFIQQMFGYSLTGSVSEQKIFIHHGGGSNGKSKLLDCLAMLTGEYCTRLACNSFSRNQYAMQKEINRLGAKLEGKRVAILDDLDSKSQWDEGVVKNMTSQEITSRKLYEEERVVINRCKLHMGCNEAPVPESENYGILRRLCFIPYNRQFVPSADKDRELQQMFRSELSGILNWSIQGLAQIMNEQEGELVCPPEVNQSIEDYKSDNFSVEAVVSGLYTRCTKLHGLDKNGDLALGRGITLNEAHEKVNQKLIESGLAHKKISLDALGRLLTQQFKIKVCRKVIDGQKVRVYPIKDRLEE